MFVVFKACSNRDRPDAKAAFKKQTKISTKCGCKASFNVNSITGVVTWPEENHVEACVEQEVSVCTYATLSSLKPSTKKAVVASTLKFLESARGLKISQAKQVVQKEIIQHLPFLPFVPLGATKSLTDAAVKTSRQGLSPSETAASLITRLKDQKFSYRVLTNTANFVSYVGWVHNRDYTADDLRVLTSDVTHGITEAASGIQKWSSWSTLSVTHKLRKILSGGLLHEDTPTFSTETELLLEVYPWLKYHSFVLLVDGDMAKWQAAKTAFEHVTIIFCLYHASENMKKHFGKLCRSTKKVDDSVNDYWVQCDSCQRWRRLPNYAAVEALKEEFYCDELVGMSCDSPCQWPTDATTSTTASTSDIDASKMDCGSILEVSQP